MNNKLECKFPWEEVLEWQLFKTTLKRELVIRAESTIMDQYPDTNFENLRAEVFFRNDQIVVFFNE